MANTDLDLKLSRLHELSERVAANLVDLEIDSSRRLLEATALAGESGARWSAASAILSDLWRWHGLLDDLLGRADKLRTRRRWSELRGLLEQESIELTRAEIPLGERDLLGRAEVAVRCTPEQLLDRMSRAFDEVKTVVARFAQGWDALTPRLDAARVQLAEATALAEQVGDGGLTDLAAAGCSLAGLEASLRSDPLSVAPADVESLIGRLSATTVELEARLREAQTLLAVVRANHAPLEARNQFRGLLDAYRAKAQRCGVVEDPELERVYEQAHDALYSSPTDLALVAQLVRRYQELLDRARQPVREATL
jgi:hypothetical protein